jgi:hypothetical protein
MFRGRLVSLGLLVLLSSATYASEPVIDIREAVRVAVVKPSDAGAATTAFDALDVTLRLEGFNVERVDSLTGRPSEYLDKAPSTHHLIVGFRSSDSNGVESAVYTQGTPSPRTFRAKSPDELVSQITEYLGSEDMVMRRIPIVRATDEFSQHMKNGLRLMLDEKNMSGAISEFTEASRLRPRDPIPHVDLALAYHHTGNREQQKKQVEEGLYLDPENLPLRNEKAVLFLEEDRFREAIGVLRELPRNDPVVQWNLSSAYWNLGERENAIAELKLIIEVQADPKLASIAETRLQELDKDASKLAMLRRSLWVSLVGLGCIAAIGAIILLARFATRGSTALNGLKPGDVLALRVQIGVTAISCVFGLLTVMLPKVIAK